MQQANQISPYRDEIGNPISVTTYAKSVVKRSLIQIMREVILQDRTDAVDSLRSLVIDCKTIPDFLDIKNLATVIGIEKMFSDGFAVKTIQNLTLAVVCELGENVAIANKELSLALTLGQVKPGDPAFDLPTRAGEILTVLNDAPWLLTCVLIRLADFYDEKNFVTEEG